MPETIKQSNNSDTTKLRESLRLLGQDHIRVDDLSDEAKANLDCLNDIIPDLKCVLKEERRHENSNDPDKGKIAASYHDIKPLPSKQVIQAGEQKSHIWMVGMDAILRGKIGVVTLAGGQGSRLGSSQPKGCYDIGLPSHSSLFELQAMRIKKLSPKLPWWIMTSASTHEQTLEFFREKKMFGLENVNFFMQEEWPAFSKDGKVLMKNKHEIFMSPNGNGGLFSSLSETGVLQEMERMEIEYVHVYCVDNALVRVADPVFVGACCLKGSDCAAKSILREDPSESMGVFCLKDDQVGIAEYSELDEVLASSRNPTDGQLLFNQGNIANHIFSLSFLLKQSQQPMYIHLAKKNITCWDPATSKEQTVAGYKLETFIFDAFKHAKNPLIFQCSRSEEFAPLKNAPGAATDTPEHCKLAVMRLHTRWLTSVDAQIQIPNTISDPQDRNKDGEKDGDALIECSPLVSYSGEDLEAWRDQVIIEKCLR